MTHIKILTIVTIFIVCSCKSRDYNKEITETNLSNYSFVKEIKFQGNTLGYSFYTSKLKDSIRWEEPNTPQIGFAIVGKNINRIHIRSYHGHLPDSLDFLKVRTLILDNSILKGNKYILPNNRISFLYVYNSFLYDSIFTLSTFPNLEKLEVIDSKTNFVINDSLPLKQLGYMETDSLFPPRKIKIDFNKLPNLKALSFKCRNCQIDIPNDSLGLTYKKDEEGIEITKGSYPIIPNMD